MPSMMMRPFSRSPRNSQDAVPSRARPHSFSAAPANSLNVPTPTPDTARRASMSVEMRGMRRLEQRRNMEESHYLNCKARDQNFNPPVDLRSIDYVSPYDTNLMCAICRCPFVDPVVLTECDHCFCRDCIRQTWNSRTTYTPLGPRGDCPTCRTPAKLGPRSGTSKIIVNIVDELIVKCPKSTEGCKAEVRRGELQDHVNIYCSYTLIECPESYCDQPVRRKDTPLGCLHYGVSCLSCHKELQKWRLDLHWRSECPDRKIHCEMCKSAVLYRDMELHSRETCPSISVPCPGKAFGCASRSKRGQSEIHAKACTFAKLAPILLKQQERLDEQEAAQKEMSHKLEVMETGISAMHSILFPRDDASTHTADSSSIPHLPHTLLARNNTTASSTQSSSGLTFDGEDPSPETSSSTHLHPSDRASSSADFFPPPSPSGGPYSSPVHHLLSLHESLRDELARLTAALAELDARHSMQTLNENLRTREEIAYLGAQVAGVQRQVGWLTSGELQRQQTTQQRGRGSPAAGAGMGDAGSSVGVDAAVSAVGTAAAAVRGAARMVGSASGGMVMRRGNSEEGRTKL